MGTNGKELSREDRELKKEIALLEAKSGPEEVRLKLEKTKGELQEKEALRDSLHGDLGVLEQKKKDIAESKEQRRLFEKEKEGKNHRLGLSKSVAQAFGKDGIPAMIVEKSVPLLEKIASEILGEMTGGEHRLCIETQRDLKSPGRQGRDSGYSCVRLEWAPGPTKPSPEESSFASTSRSGSLFRNSWQAGLGKRWSGLFWTRASEARTKNTGDWFLKRSKPWLTDSRRFLSSHTLKRFLHGFLSR